MNYTIYNPETGQIVGHINATDDQTAQANLVDCAWVPGIHDASLFYIDQGSVLALPNKPDNTQIMWDFDWSNKSWVHNLSATALHVRNIRNNMLAIVDRVNPVWYDTLTQDQKTQLQNYRQDLLDVPQQAGFPVTVEWPAKPSWL